MDKIFLIYGKNSRKLWFFVDWCGN